jgi:hypothetical protein
MKVILVKAKTGQWLPYQKHTDKSIILSKTQFGQIVAVLEEHEAIIELARINERGFNAYDIDSEKYFEMQRQYQPVCKVIENSETANSYNIKPWHHLYFYGNKVIKVIWDTRVVEEIFDINGFGDEDFANMYFITDTCTTLKPTDASLEALHKLTSVVGAMSTITSYQLSLIKQNQES